MARMRDRLDAPVLIGVGAAFDFHAGLVPQAPDRAAAARARVGVPARAGAAPAVAALPALQPALRDRLPAPVPATPAGAAGRETGAGGDPRRRAARRGSGPCRRLRRQPAPRRRAAPGDMVVVARGADGAIYERHLAAGAWTPWRSIGGQAIVRPGGRRVRDGDPRVRRSAPTSPCTRTCSATAPGPAGRSLGGGGVLGALGDQPARHEHPRPRDQRAPTTRSTTASSSPGAGWSGWGSLGGGAHERAGAQLAGPGRAQRVRARDRRPALPALVDRDRVVGQLARPGRRPARRPAVVSRQQNQRRPVRPRAPTARSTSATGTAAPAGPSWIRLDATPLDSAPAAGLRRRRGTSCCSPAAAAASRSRSGGRARGWSPWVNWGPVAPPPPAPPPPPPPDGNVELTTGDRCTPPGGRLRVSLKIRTPPGAARAARPARRVLRQARPAPRGPPAALRPPARAQPPGRLARPRLRARVLHPQGLEEGAPQDRVQALRDVRLG